MIRRLSLISLLTFCFIANALSQNKFTISGIIKSDSEMLAGAGVYISGYKISTSSDSEGRFSLNGLAPGNYDILVKLYGYESYTTQVMLSDKSVKLNIILKENITQLKEVVIKPDPDRAYYLQLFKDAFIGKSPNSLQCSLLNDNVLFIDFDKENRVLTVKADDFLIIENKALGYRLKYLLQNFEYDFKSHIIFYSGFPFFEELKGSKAKLKRWEKKRLIAYNGSAQHFYKSLYENKLDEEGFLIYKLVKIPNPNRLPDSLINANIKRLTAGQEGIRRTITFTSSDSLAYWLKQRKAPKELHTINRKKILTDTLVKVYNKNLKMMQFKDALYVIYKNERESAVYQNSGSWQSRPLDIPDYQISIIHCLKPAIYFYANGGTYDPQATLYEGYWNYEKMADIMPLDYIPTAQK